MSQLLSLIEENNIESTDKQTLLERFNDYEDIATEWEVKARTIVVTSADQKTEMAMAKEARKKFSLMRQDIEKARVAMKEQSLRKGKVIDSIAKYLTGLVSPIEQYLLKQEDFVEIQEKVRIAELKEKFEKQANEERIQREKADAIERETLRAENAKLTAEAQARENEMRQEAQAKQKIADELAFQTSEVARIKIVQEMIYKKEADDKAEAIENEKKDQLKNASDARYTAWLKENNYNIETMKVVRGPQGHELWQRISTLEI